MLTFCGTESKKDTIKRMKGHVKADELVKGQYWSGRKGCAVGCMTGSDKHCEYPKRWGIPEEIARLEDSIFEHLDNGESQKWPIQFLEAIPERADLSMVWPKLALKILADPKSPVVINGGQCADAIKGVADLYREWVDTGTKPAKDRWESAARSAAWSAASAAWSAASAARSAAWSAASAAWSAEGAESAARSAAWSAASAERSAESAASAARSAAWSAASAERSAESAARSAAWSAAYSAKNKSWQQIRDWLLAELKAAPVVKD